MSAASVLSRADAGQQDEARFVEFYVHPVMAAASPYSTSLAHTPRQVFEAPEASSSELDRMVARASSVVFHNRPRPPR